MTSLDWIVFVVVLATIITESTPLEDRYDRPRQ